ncbi:DNA-binding response regulator [Flaviramulus sp. BrNp1-15]|uniref:DNA-binding response regulator n=1 Tax=Flaviramulus sp. BrNp1-15 TaxID=2916754 RepID=UPI001EE878B5|nr:DNA-binding response regulator [Flaviramulus sp. BrNp1-15]ULC57920.1 DNA-binding response regulator [Flaviramulus sp. BrNp1-15]
MIKPLNTLIIEDHQLIIDGYIRALDYVSSKNHTIQFKITVAKNCDEANLEIERAIENKLIDLVFLDISLPPSKTKKIVSGDDLGIKLRCMFPKVKIIVSTHLNNNYRLVNILKTVKPNGLLLKSELNFQNLTEGILNIIYDIPYYSKPVLKLVRQHISNDFNLDDIDRQMLYQLSLGAKTKELPEVVHLSLAGIERRKRRLNQIFNNDKKSDKVLLRLARENGFL